MDSRIKVLAAGGILAGLLYSMKKEDEPDSSGGSKWNPFATVSGGMAGGGGGGDPNVTYTTYNIPAPVFPTITAPDFGGSSDPAPTKKEINSGQSSTLHRPRQPTPQLDRILGKPSYEKTPLELITPPSSITPYITQPTKKEQKQTTMPDALKLPGSISPYV